MNAMDLDQKCMTFTRYVLEQQANFPHAHGDLTNVLLSIQVNI